MNKITELSIAVFLRIQSVHARATKRLAEQDTERGSNSVETVVILAAVVLMAVAMIAIIAKKVIAKADSISF